MNAPSPAVRPLVRWIVALFVILCGALPGASAYEPQTLEVGAPAPAFDLLGTDDNRYTLADFADKSVLVIVFTTNHCPDAIASYQRK